MKAWGVFLCATTAAAQTQWSSGFDSDVERLTDWNGDTAKYIVKSSALSLDAPSLSSQTFVYRSSGVQCAAEWRIDLRLDFNPSSANYAKVFVWSDAAQPDSCENGLWLRIGGSTEDRISLFERRAGIDQLKIESPPGFLDRDLNALSIYIKSDSSGLASVGVDSSGLGAMDLGSAALSNPAAKAEYFIWTNVFTSTRSKSFHLDSVSAKGFECMDNSPPRAIGIELIDSFKLELRFNEEIELGSLEDPAHYALSSPGREVSLALAAQDARSVLLFLSTPLAEGTADQLTCSDLQDLSGNISPPQSLSFSWGHPVAGALVINEIHFDPEPVRLLPLSEYLEIFNPTAQAQSTRSWTLEIDGESVELPDCFLLAGAHAVFVANTNSSLWPIEVSELELSEPFLPNGGARIELRNPDGDLIDAVEYRPGWHLESDAKEGGISLERIDPRAICEQEGNWQSAPSLAGGSPGAQNAEGTSDLSETRMRPLRWLWNDLAELEVQFAKGLGIGPISEPNFRIEPHPGPFEARWDEMHSNLWISFALPLAPDLLYTLLSDSVWVDCTGQAFIFESIQFGMPQAIEPGDVLISELHFEPGEGESEFIELWNLSQKMLDPSALRLVELEPGSLNSLEVGPPFDSELWPPSTALVFGDGLPRGRPKSECRDETRYRAGDLPSLDNESGALGLIDSRLNWVDRVSYQSEFHFFRLEETRGVSLERISTTPEAHRSDHWVSSRSKCNFSSPGLWNPQLSERKNGVWVSSPNLSPNSDGYLDELLIRVELDSKLYQLEWQVYGPDGREVARIDQKRLSSGSDLMVWDGRTTAGTLAPPGLYLLRVEAESAESEPNIWWISFGLMP